MIKKIIFCANRPDKGGSGGGAGVMHLLRTFLDEEKCACKIKYQYRDGSLLEFIKALLKEGAFKEGTYFICHEPESAALLSFFHRRYSLIYHQQGSYVEEYLGREKKPSVIRMRKKALYERMAFRGADVVYFPSRGAEEMFFNSKYATIKREEIRIGNPLYNTIDPNEVIVPIEGVERDTNCITLLSVGTLTKLKGQDQVFVFIKKILEYSNQNIRWITVGDGVLKNKLIEDCNDLMKLQSRFKHIHFDKIQHGSVLYLDSISDIYIMFHRSSIFDLATLEAMSKKNCIILSNIGGNKDFDKEGNVLLIDPDNMMEGLEKLISSDIYKMKVLNEKIFHMYFSPDAFNDRYIKLINNIVDNSK